MSLPHARLGRDALPSVHLRQGRIQTARGAPPKKTFCEHTIEIAGPVKSFHGKECATFPNEATVGEELSYPLLYIVVEGTLWRSSWVSRSNFVRNGWNRRADHQSELGAEEETDTLHRNRQVSLPYSSLRSDLCSGKTQQFPQVTRRHRETVTGCDLISCFPGGRKSTSRTIRTRRGAITSRVWSRR